MRKRLQETAVGFQLEENAAGRPVARVTLIKAGLSLNGHYYPADVLAEATHLYEGKPCLLDHSWSPSVRDIAGWFRNVRWSRENQSIEAELHFLDTTAGRVLLELAREENRLQKDGVLPDGQHVFGFSHVVFAESEMGTADGVDGETVIVKKIVEVLSVDAVAFPAAGGKLNDLKEARQEAVCPNLETVKEAMRGAVERAMETMEEGATRFRNLPLASRSRAWDANAATRRLRKFASEDGSGNKDTIRWNRYRWGFFWYDSNDPEKFTAYKLPFADIVNGELTAVPRGVFAAAAVIQGSRGGVNIPESDIPAVKRHIEAYYRKMSREWDDPNLVPPWKREDRKLTNEEIAAYIEAFGLDKEAARYFAKEFGYSPNDGDSTTEAVEVGQEDESMKEKDKKVEGDTPVKESTPTEKEIREQIAAEFADKLRGLIEERNSLAEQVEQLKEQIAIYEAEKKEAERKAKLDELFTKYGIEGAAREALEGVVNDLDLEKAAKVIELAAARVEPKEKDNDVPKKTSESNENDPVKVGIEFAKEVFGIEVDA